MSTDDDFFEAPEERSIVKSKIVLKYFAVWSTVMASQADMIGYFDFYSGPGRYRDGTPSTPLLILEKAAAAPALAKRLVTIFNDANEEYAANLESEIDKLEGVDRLVHTPQVHSEASDDLVPGLEAVETVPSLSFIDPWGYKGLSSRLIRAAIKAWGCDVIFFFNYNRINMGISNPKIEAHMEAIFGEERLRGLRNDAGGLAPAERETQIIAALEGAVADLGAPNLLPFTFRRENGRVSHYICFVSKHPRGYSIMKDVMASEGAVDEDGVPLFEYIPQSRGRQLSFGPRPLVQLPESLLKEFAGRKITRSEIYEQHNVGTPFLEKHYRQVLKEMESRGEITCEVPEGRTRRRGSFPGWLLVIFPAI